MVASLCWLILGCLVGSLGTLWWLASGTDDDDDENDDDDLQADESDASGSRWMEYPTDFIAEPLGPDMVPGDLITVPPKPEVWERYDTVVFKSADDIEQWMKGHNPALQKLETDWRAKQRNTLKGVYRLLTGRKGDK